MIKRAKCDTVQQKYSCNKKTASTNTSALATNQFSIVNTGY